MPDETDKPTQTTIGFHYQRKPNHRSVFVDGVIGGLTPRGRIQMTPYTERTPVPQYLQHPITDQGRVNEQEVLTKVSRDGLIREFEVSLVMDLTTATALRDWLDETIKAARANDSNTSEGADAT